MTTIATDGKTMAGDGLSCTRGVIAARNTPKIIRMADGGLWGSCGCSGWGDKLLAWYNGGKQGDPPKGDDGDGFMFLSPDGKLWQGGSDGLACEIDVPFAMGSGMDFAIGAMEAGKTPAEAIEIASRRDPHTGGTITSLALIEPPASADGYSFQAGMRAVTNAALQTLRQHGVA